MTTFGTILVTLAALAIVGLFVGVCFYLALDIYELSEEIDRRNGGQ